MSRIEAQAKTMENEHASQLEAQTAITSIAAAELQRERAAAEQQAAIRDKAISQRSMEIEAETKALVEKAKAIAPDLIAALQAFGDRELIERVAKAMGPIGILDLAGGKSVTDVLKQILAGSPLANALPEAKPNGNGHSKRKQVTPEA